MRPHLLCLPLLCALLVPAQRAAAQSCPARDGWPTAGWPSRVTQTAAARAAEISALEQYAFTLEGADADRKGVRTDGLVIIQGGALVYERYGRGFTATNRHIAWSMTKSAMNALTGVAVHKGVLALTDSVCRFYPEAPADHCAITPVNLMEWTSGLDWKEVYENESNQQSSVLAMLYGMGHRDRASFVLQHPLYAAPGTRYVYSTGDATLLGGLLQRAGKPTLGDDWMHTELFDKLGMASATLERDAAGGPTGGSYLYATPRDFAKFGWLFLNDGCWNAERLLPEGWVHDSLQVVAAYKTNNPEPDPAYIPARSWWLNLAVPETGDPVPYPHVPTDAYFARGHWGQSIAVIPSLEMVVVRTGDDRETGVLDYDKFLQLAIAVGRAP